MVTGKQDKTKYVRQLEMSEGNRGRALQVEEDKKCEKVGGDVFVELRLIEQTDAS
jgi:hypothetical protein